MRSNDIRRIRRLELVLLLFFPLGFNEDRKASRYSRTSNLRRGIVVTSARIISARPISYRRFIGDLQTIYRRFIDDL